MSPRLRAVVIAVLALSALLAPAAAEARDLLSTSVSAPHNEDRSCTSRLLGGAAQPAATLTAPAGGWVTARLEGDGPGDWDLAIFDTGTGRVVAGSAAFGSVELADGVVATGSRLAVQACRRSGETATAKLDVTLDVVEASKGAKVQFATVAVPSRARFAELQELGLDLADHGGKGSHDVILYGAADRAKLRAAKFTYKIEIDDLVAHDRSNRLRDRADAARSRRSAARALPSGRTGPYRRLPDYQNELKQLVSQNPGLVRPVQLPFKTYEGRIVEGVEISTDVNARDGKPVFLNMGVHHAREWPAAEHSIEWAHELVNGARGGNARITNLLGRARVIVIPVVNPDGFNISREAGEALGASNGRGDPPAGGETANIVAVPLEYRRKNCRRPDDDPSGSCATASQGLAEPGVDPNRNYGGFWGGPGASTDPTNLTYRGPAPFSEPETRNIRDLVSKRQVTTLITNHTFSALVLRPPGLQVQGPSPDEGIYKALGDSMAAENGYLSQLSYQLYDTTGTTEDWSYYATGGLGFTFEIGCKQLDREGGKCDAANFHPPYSEMIAEYEGTSPIADDLKPDGLGNREAYFKALEHTADASKHSVLEGAAPAGAVLRLKKSFKTQTFPQADGKPIEFDDTLDTTLEVPSSGRFEWHVNPSTRPIVARARGRQAEGPPSGPISFSGGAPGATTPCADAETDDPACFEEFAFAVPAAGVDNARASIRIQWTEPISDWDMKVFRDGNDDGDSLDPEDTEVGSSAQGTTDFEETTLSEPVLEEGGRYVVRVINFASGDPYQGTVTFGGPPAFEPARTESWTLTCERPSGEVLSSQQITIARGQRQSPDLSACASALGAVATPISARTPDCASAAILRSVKTTAAGRGVRVAFSKQVSQKVNVDVFQVTAGRRVIGERLVARFRNKARSFTWDGRSRRKRVRPGFFFARYSIKLPNGQSDVRRKVFRLQGGRFTARPDFYRRDTCGLLRSYKLERPAFGGSTRRPLRAAFRLTRAGTVRVQVLRGATVVKTLVNSKRFAAGRTHRASLRSAGLRKGDYKVRITVRRAGSRTATSTLTTRKL